MNDSFPERVIWETRICPLCKTNFLLVSCQNLHHCNKADCHLRYFFFFTASGYLGSCRLCFAESQERVTSL